VKPILEKIVSLEGKTIVSLVGEGRVGAKAMPSAVASLINYSANECSMPILIIGQVVHIWNGVFYEPGRIYDLIECSLDKLSCPISLAIDGDFVRSVEKCLSVCSDRWGSNVNTNPRGLNFLDGSLMISRDSMIFMEFHDPTNVFTYCLPFKYMGEREEGGVWKTFIEKAIPDEVMRNYALASLANSLAGDPLQSQRMLILMGVAASGKSTLIDAVVNVVGKRNVCRVDDLSNLTKDESRYRIDLANHILCICGDASGNLGNKDVLKQIVSKEEISGRRLYKEVEYFVPRASLIVASNEFGFTHALGDSGISRRIDIIQFLNAIPESERDPFISEKLANPIEQKEMLFDMIRCFAHMQNDYGKMVRPKRLATILDDFRHDGDVFLSFLGASGLECGVSGNSEHEWIHQERLYGAYAQFCVKNGNQTGSMRTFKGKCESHGIPKEAAGQRKHTYLFNVVDRQAYTEMFYYVTGTAK
jgi:P4 family phage/plasmid primase-like protien